MTYIIQILKEELKKVEAELAEIDLHIEDFHKPFPREEDYENRHDFVMAYLGYLESHTQGKFSIAAMRHVWARKTELELKKDELRREIDKFE